jgi:DNA-binding SARP family transcriptional activator/tetratricopeptide (TPR) repeat protein
VDTVLKEISRSVWFEVLGPLYVVSSAGRRVRLRSSRQQIILAMLVLGANRVVSTDSLVDAVWEEAPPATARGQVHICISSIRRLLREFDTADLISTQPGGYLLQVDPERLDFRQFEQLCEEASGLAEQGLLSRAAATLRSALGIWRGKALSGISSSSVVTRAVRLDEDRLGAQEKCVEWELRLGWHRELVGELAERVAENPLRERSRAQLMLALNLAGRPAEALDLYRRGRQELVEKLGLEPGEELRRMEARILAGRPNLPKDDQRSAAPLPVRQLPAGISDFVGRAKQVDAISAMLDRTPSEVGHEPVAPVVVTGIGGAGKSTLAIHVAHILARNVFTDGQLYANLGGGSERPEQPGEVLGRFLRALGIYHTAIPEGTAERADLYRSLLAGRKVLVVLDNVVGEQQVRPLLPGSATCGVLVTSRFRLAGLAGSHSEEVRAFGEEEAADFLDRVIGSDRVAHEYQQVVELTRLVGGLPLGLRIIGAKLAARPHWTLRRVVQLLSDEERRLDELMHGDLGVRPSIALTYDGLADREKFLLQVLCEFGVEDFPGWTAVATLEVDQFEALEALENLVEAQLVDVVPGDTSTPVRYRHHELVRIFARERAAEQPPAQRSAALARVFGGWLSLAEQAHQRLYGGQFTVLHGSAERWQPAEQFAEQQLVDDPLRWFDVERVNLCASVGYCAAAGLDELSWDLAVTLVTLFEVRSLFEEWKATHEVALAATRRTGNRRGEAAVLCSLGSLHFACGQTVLARAMLDTALQIFTALGERRGRALAARNLAMVDHRERKFDDARVRYGRALADFRGLDDHIGEAHVLIKMAKVDIDRGQLDDVSAQLERALQLSRLAGHRRTEAQALRGLGEAFLVTGWAPKAIAPLRGALDLVRVDGDRVGEMHVLHEFGRTYRALARYESAADALRAAMALARDVGDPVTCARIEAELAPVYVGPAEVAKL